MDSTLRPNQALASLLPEKSLGIGQDRLRHSVTINDRHRIVETQTSKCRRASSNSTNTPDTQLGPCLYVCLLVCRGSRTACATFDVLSSSASGAVTHH